MARPQKFNRRPKQRPPTIVGKVALFVVLCATASHLSIPDLIPHTPGVTVAGSAVVIDGDTLQIQATRIRLFGIDAPEGRQQCRNTTGGYWPCGEESTRKLRALVSGQSVTCSPKYKDAYNRTVAVCRTSAGDVGAQMVATGWALDYARYSGGQYRSQENQAKAMTLGIWRGPFTAPWDYRHRT